jgi:hypothetical protein
MNPNNMRMDIQKWEKSYLIQIIFLVTHIHHDAT